MADDFPIAFGRYQLVERLATGGMAELFLAEAKGAHGFAKTLVIKRILPHLAADQQFTAMFIDEAKITARLAHPKIAQTYELGREGERLYIAMEYVDGLDVLAVLRECAHRRVRISPELSVYVCKEVLDALDFAHRQTDEQGKPLGIVHRDISPSNVLLSRRGDVKLVDFGIAHALQSDHHTKAGTLKGKYGYMSPEQVLGGKVTAQSDLFSVGVVLAEMLTGRRLFAAPNELDVLLMVRDVKLGRLDRFGAHIAPDLDKVLRHSLAKSPADRFPDAAAFRDALDEWLFENRHRVAPKQIADLVDSLHEDANTRRLQALAESQVAPSPVHEPATELPAASGVIAAAPPRAAPADPSDGIPQGTIDLALSGEIVIAVGPAQEDSDTTSRYEIKPSPPAKGTPVRSPPGRPNARAARLPEPAPAAEEGDDLLDLGDLSRELGLDPVTHPPASIDRGPDLGPALAEPVLAVELGLGPAGSRLGGGPAAAAPRRGASPARRARPALGHEASAPHAIDEDVSMRYPDISAAVAAVAPNEADPASRDFDDKEVSDLAAKKARRSMRLPSVEELARTPKPTPPKAADIQDTPAEQGDLSRTSPLDIFFRLATTKAGGLLVVSVGEIKKEIYLTDGIPEFVSSNLAGELFGAYLVAEGAVSSGELDMALAMLPYFSGKLGDTLVGLGLMKPLDVFRHLTRQVRQKLLDVCTWTKGVYTWFPGRKNPREAFPLDLDPFEVLGAGAMALAATHVQKWGEKQGRRVYRAVATAKVVPEVFRLGRIGREVLLALDGHRTVQDLVSRYSAEADRVQFLRALYLFDQTGLASDEAPGS